MTSVLLIVAPSDVEPIVYMYFVSVSSNFRGYNVTLNPQIAFNVNSIRRWIQPLNPQK